MSFYKISAELVELLKNILIQVKLSNVSYIELTNLLKQLNALEQLKEENQDASSKTTEE